jgi:hypothetical protein
LSLYIKYTTRWTTYTWTINQHPISLIRTWDTFTLICIEISISRTTYTYVICTWEKLTIMTTLTSKGCSVDILSCRYIAKLTHLRWRIIQCIIWTKLTHTISQIKITIKLITWNTTSRPQIKILIHIRTRKTHILSQICIRCLKWTRS